MGVFRFRQFEVCDDQATMKVGTDAVLLGAWATVEGASRILDIGTGSGVIALMMAQRSAATALIDAVEINLTDAEQARKNVSASPWSAKIHVIHKPVQEYFPEQPYDLIVSNPPFFSASLLPPNTERATARHHVSLSAGDLILQVRRLIATRGRFAVILPATDSERFIEVAVLQGFHLARRTGFFTRREKPQERTLLEFSTSSVTSVEDTLTLYQMDDQWTSAYTDLTEEFYLPRS